MAVKVDDISWTLHAMIDIIGMDKFMEISKLYGGSNVYIPIYSKVIMGDRNRNIILEYNSGKTVDSLRLKYNLTKQQIKLIIKSL